VRGLAANFPLVTRDRLGVSTAIVGLVLALVLLPLGFMTSELLVKGVPLSLGTGCVLYLLSVHATDRRLAVPAIDLPGQTVIPQLITVGLSALVTVAVLTGRRSLLFLVLTSVVGSLLMAHISFAEESALNPRSVLVGIVAYATIIRFAGLFTMPGVIGIDTWTHVTSYAAAIQSGHSLSAIAGIKYLTAPFYHLIAVTGAELLGLSLRNAVYLTVGTLMPLSVLATYAAGRYVTTVRWALFATLVFAVSEYVIEWGLIVSTTSLGLVFFLAVFLFLVRILYSDPERADYLLAVGFAMAVTLTHQMSAFVTLALLGTATVVSLASNWFGRYWLLGEPDTPSSRALVGMFTTYLAFTTALWSVTPWTGEPFLFRGITLLQRWFNSRVGFLHIAERTGRSASGSTPSGLAAQLAPVVDNLGFLLLLLVAVSGCLVLLQRGRSVGSLTLIATLGVMAVVSLGLPLFGFEFFLPKRWFAFMHAPMAIAGAVGVGYVVRQTSSRAVVAGFLLFVLVFPGAMVAAERATVDDPTFPEQWPEYAYSQSEIDAAETIHRIVPSDDMPVYTDHPYYTVLSRLNQDPAERRSTTPSNRGRLLPLTASSEASADYAPAVYRTYQSEGRPIFEGEAGSAVQQQVAREKICGPGRNHVYATEGVRMCTNPGT